MKRNVFIVTVNGFAYRVEASTALEAIRALRIAGEQGVINDGQKEG